MGQYGTIKEIEIRVRSTTQYSEWVIRHKAAFCLRCNSREKLECHHVIELYHIVLGLWKLYGNEEDVFTRTITLHEENMCECATLCDTCHQKLHPAKHTRETVKVRSEEWSAFPRNLDITLAHSTWDPRPDALGLIAVQTLFALGWYILNGHMESRILEINRRSLARLMGKTPSTSFNKSLNRSLTSLETTGIILASHVKGNSIEIHMAPKYLSDMRKNPWFIPLSELKTPRMTVLALKWFLSMQSKRKRYRIGIPKLRKHLGIITSHSGMVAKAVRSACDQIPWANVEIKKGMCDFTIKRRGATPIHSLRALLFDSIEYGN